MSIQDILEDIGDSTKYNLHGHTEFCDGRNTMAEFADEAVRQGFTHYGFTPHSPIPIESPCNMKTADVPSYFTKVDEIRASHPQVKFYRGMEIDYLGKDWGPSHPYYKSLTLDYTIGSVHFIPSQDGAMVDIDGPTERFAANLKDKFHGDLEYVVETFFKQSHDMLAAGGLDIIGHLDKVKHNAGACRHGLEESQWYMQLSDDLVDDVISRGVAVEINTKAWRQSGHYFPGERHWRRLIDAGVPILVNSDAHYAERINESREYVLKALSRMRQNVLKS